MAFLKPILPMCCYAIVATFQNYISIEALFFNIFLLVGFKIICLNISELRK